MAVFTVLDDLPPQNTVSKQSVIWEPDHARPPPYCGTKVWVTALKGDAQMKEGNWIATWEVLGWEGVHVVSKGYRLSSQV